MLLFFWLVVSLITNIFLTLQAVNVCAQYGRGGYGDSYDQDGSGAGHWDKKGVKRFYGSVFHTKVTKLCHVLG